MLFSGGSAGGGGVIANLVSELLNLLLICRIWPGLRGVSAAAFEPASKLPWTF